MKGCKDGRWRIIFSFVNGGLYLGLGCGSGKSSSSTDDGKISVGTTTSFVHCCEEMDPQLDQSCSRIFTFECQPVSRHLIPKRIPKAVDGSQNFPKLGIKWKNFGASTFG